MARIAGLRLKERWDGWQREPFTSTRNCVSVRTLNLAQLKIPARHADQRGAMRIADLSRSMLRFTSGILALWAIWGLVEALTDHFFLFYSFRSFGLISPLVGLFCLVFSVAGLLQAKQRGGPKRHALAAIFLSVVIAVVPFWALPFDPS